MAFQNQQTLQARMKRQGNDEHIEQGELVQCSFAKIATSLSSARLVTRNCIINWT
jgi:hypothetical protein